MFQSIVVPLDGSVFGEHALPLALTMARRAKTPIKVTHVHEPLAVIYAEAMVGQESSLDPAIRARESAYMTDVVERLRAASDVPVSSVMLEGSVADALHEHVLASKADLMVMTTHGRGPLRRFWLGSVLDQMVRRTSIPILVTHPTEKKPDFKLDVQLSEMLIPLDGSPVAESILEPAMALAEVFRSNFNLLRIVGDALPAGFLPAIAEGLGEDRLGQLQEEAQVYLDRVAERFKGKGAKVRTIVRIGFQPAADILTEADLLTHGMTALSTHARRGLSRILLGSVADKVLRGSSHPVLVYRPNVK